jgi:WD40 repeat protein
MPTTRSRRAAARAAERRLLDLPADVLGLILYQLPLAHDIALTGLTCRLLCNAAKLVLKLRPFSGEVVRQDMHPMPVRAVAVAADGRIISTSSSSYDGVISHAYLPKASYDAGSWLSHAHNNCIRAVAVLPGGPYFVSGSDDGTAKMWAFVGAPSRVRTFAVGAVVMSVAALPDGVHFVVGASKEVRLYHVDGTLVHTFRGHDRVVRALALTPDGQHIISGSWDHTVKVWSVATKSLNTFSELHTNHVHALVALPDNQHALSGSADHTVKLFNVNDGAALRTFKHHINVVTSLALLPDGRRFVSGSWDVTVRIAEHGLAPQKPQ